MMIKKGIADLAGIDFQAGQLILIDKPIGWTSFRVVHEIRKAVNVKKVGHAGSLDPLATGLLILATGKKTKEIDFYQAKEKTYSGTITLGITTPSMDLETLPDAYYDITGITAETIENARKKFTGKILQTPPMYSAIKLKGKTMYKLARKGKKLELSAREIEITRFDVTEINLPYINFEITSSKGTYIRSIANDLGKELGCGGVLSSLRRTRIGEFCVEDAFKMNEILQLLESSYKEEVLPDA
jgi:tRNA pseudouridine55 synthase